MIPGRTVSVVIPTYHRPEHLERAVRSVVEQQLPDGTDLEVVISVSDAESDADRATAHSLALEDDRIRVVVAPRKGPGVARNTGMAAAKGDFIGLLDDDCEAQPGWIMAGLRRLEEVDLVQGRTEPRDPVNSPYDKTIWVPAFSGLWESCNLFLRRSVIDRHGGFDEHWNPTGIPGEHWAEDTEWGWRVVRGGTTYAFEPDAFVRHAVFPQTFREWFHYETKMRHWPLMVREIPELRDQVLVNRYFLFKRQRTLTIAAALLLLAALMGATGRSRTAKAAAVLAVAPLTSAHARNAYYAVQKEWVHFGALVYGSIRHRRVVL